MEGGENLLHSILDEGFNNLMKHQNSTRENYFMQRLHESEVSESPTMLQNISIDQGFNTHNIIVDATFAKDQPSIFSH
jgi:hypothetical protein